MEATTKLLLTRLLILGTTAAILVGCGASNQVVSSFRHHDPQACVERALAGHHDRKLLSMSRDHFEASCAAGDMAACSTLGLMNERGLATALDPVKAHHLYELSCAANNGGGCEHLGMMLIKGGRMAPAPDRGVKLLTKACSLGKARACHVLADLHRTGGVVPKSDARATKLYGTGCELGYAASCYALGSMNEAMDIVKAEMLYQQACRNGYDAGCARLDALFVERRTRRPPIPQMPECVDGRCAAVAAR